MASMAVIIEGREAAQMSTALHGFTAKDIFEMGLAYDYMYDTWTSMHWGDEFLGKALIATIPIGSLKDAQGCHICVVGEAGIGKSHSQHCAIKLIPPEYKFNGTITPQSLYYSSDIITPGSIINIDDLVWSDSLGATIKKITSVFSNQVQKLSVNNGEAILESAVERPTFWISQVEMQADEQIRDRFIIVDIEGSKERIEEVKEFMNRNDRGDGISSSELDMKIEVCQNIVRILREQGVIEVVIPFADRIKTSGNLRAHRMFMDLVKSFTIFDFMNRKKDDRSRLIAIEDDFYRAKDIFDGIGGTSSNKYTSKERGILQSIIDNGYRASFAEVSSKTGINEQYIRDIVFGRGKDQQQKHGLISKCNALSYDNKIRPYKLRLGKDVDMGPAQVELIPVQDEISKHEPIAEEPITA